MRCDPTALVARHLEVFARTGRELRRGVAPACDDRGGRSVDRRVSVHDFRRAPRQRRFAGSTWPPQSRHVGSMAREVPHHVSLRDARLGREMTRCLCLQLRARCPWSRALVPTSVRGRTDATGRIRGEQRLCFTRCRVTLRSRAPRSKDRRGLDMTPQIPLVVANHRWSGRCRNTVPCKRDPSQRLGASSCRGWCKHERRGPEHATRRKPQRRAGNRVEVKTALK